MVSAFFYVLFDVMNVSSRSDALTAGHTEVQIKANNLAGIINTDTRQTVVWEVANTAANAPSPSHIKFRKVDGWDTAANALLLNSTYIEYTFDAANTTVTRRLCDSSNNTIVIGGSAQQWVYSNITQAPFFTKDSGGNLVALNSADLLASGKLICTVVTERQITGLNTVNATVTTEIKIRNG